MTRNICANFSSPTLGSLHMKFELNSCVDPEGGGGGGGGGLAGGSDPPEKSQKYRVF